MSFSTRSSLARTGPGPPRCRAWRRTPQPRLGRGVISATLYGSSSPKASVLQLEGESEWTLARPSPDEPDAPARIDIAGLEAERVPLRAGDGLYIPYGRPHRVDVGDGGNSLHVVVTVAEPTVQDVVNVIAGELATAVGSAVPCTIIQVQLGPSVLAGDQALGHLAETTEHRTGRGRHRHGRCGSRPTRPEVRAGQAVNARAWPEAPSTGHNHVKRLLARRIAGQRISDSCRKDFVANSMYISAVRRCGRRHAGTGGDEERPRLLAEIRNRTESAVEHMNRQLIGAP